MLSIYTKFDILTYMKDIIWLGSTHHDVKGYPAEVRQDIGYNLDKVQRGLEPSDWKPMPSHLLVLGRKIYVFMQIMSTGLYM